MSRDIFQRYREDPVFHNLVKVLVQHLRQADMTGTEVREAATLAAQIHEMTATRILGLPRTAVVGPDGRFTEDFVSASYGCYRGPHADAMREYWDPDRMRNATHTSTVAIESAQSKESQGSEDTGHG